MFDKKKIIEVLRDLRFPTDQYCVMTGAALVLYGVKELTADIDIGCKSQLFDRLWGKDMRASKIDNARCIQLDETLEIYENWLPDAYLRFLILS